jgi:hypothetical protein
MDVKIGYGASPSGAGLMLVKSRRRDPISLDFGVYSPLIDARTNTLVRGEDEHCDLDDVERYLDGHAR